MCKNLILTVAQNGSSVCVDRAFHWDESRATGEFSFSASGRRKGWVGMKIEIALARSFDQPTHIFLDCCATEWRLYKKENFSHQRPYCFRGGKNVDKWKMFLDNFKRWLISKRCEDLWKLQSLEADWPLCWVTWRLTEECSVTWRLLIICCCEENCCCWENCWLINCCDCCWTDEEEVDDCCCITIDDCCFCCCWNCCSCWLGLGRCILAASSASCFLIQIEAACNIQALANYHLRYDFLFLWWSFTWLSWDSNPLFTRTFFSNSRIHSLISYKWKLSCAKENWTL